MSKIRIITNGAEQLLEYIKKSPVVKKDKSLEIVKKKDDKGIASITPKADGRTLGSVKTREIDVPNIPAASSTSNGNNLLSHLARKNDLMKEANDLARALVERKDIANEIAVANMTMKYDLAVSQTLAIEGLGTELKLHREFQEALGWLSVDKSNFELFGLTTDGVQLKNSDGNEIIPIHEKAKKNSEKAIETTNMNNIKIDNSLIDGMFDSDDLNPFASLIDEAQEFLTNMNKSIYDKDTQGGING